MLIMLTKSQELKGMNKNTYVDEGYQLAEEIKKDIKQASKSFSVANSISMPL